ncbi:MAG: hypothetical protein ACRBCJ_11190 [Hyphomicrobiaceae bacterium]
MAKLISSSYRRPRSPGLFESKTVPDRNAEHTKDLITQLKTVVAQAKLAKPHNQQLLTNKVVYAALGARPLPTSIRLAFSNAASQIIRNECARHYQLVNDAGSDNPVTSFALRSQLRDRLEALANDGAGGLIFENTLTSVLSKISAAIPHHDHAPSTLSISVPLYTLLDDLTQLVDAIVRTFSKLAPHTASPANLGNQLAESIVANLLHVSRISMEEAQKHPHRITWPSDVKLAPHDLIDTFFNNTPLLMLLKTTIEIPIPNHLRTEHSVITASIGHGKTQLMQSLILRDLDDPARPSIVVIDSQADAINTLSRLKRFDPDVDNRLIIIDPTDVNPPALNLFHVDRRYLNQLNTHQREEFLAGLIELFTFIAGGLLGSDLTPRMSVVFRYLSQLLIEIPDATIHTLADLLDDPSPYLHYIERLPPTAQTFIDDLYKQRSPYTETRKHIGQRIYHVLSNPAFERMFAHPQNKFDMRAALNDGKVVLINTAKGALKAEWSSILGRYFVALIMQAAFARSFIPQHQRRLALVHIDESSEYLDANIDQLLIQGRKYSTALHLYAQHMSQFADKGLKATALAIPALRYVGSLNDADATLLAKEMNTTPEFLKAVRKTTTETEWSLFVRNLTPTATRISVPFLQAEREPKMSPAAYQRLLTRNRNLIGAPRRAPLTTSRSASRNAPNNDGDEY